MPHAPGVESWVSVRESLVFVVREQLLRRAIALGGRGRKTEASGGMKEEGRVRD